MGKIYYILGKSASGKDSMLTRVLADPDLRLKGIIQYTTRPIRGGETEGKEYHFINEEAVEAFRAAGKIVEERSYNTIHGLWRYMMIDDGSVDLSRGNYAAVGTVESYTHVRNYYGAENVVPIFIDVETGERLQRALDRERTHERPKYAEMCRRFLADEADFDEAHLSAAGILLPDGSFRNRFENDVFETCFQAVKGLILGDQCN